jgi:trans-2,3-dihydro-3-hydroxyanthranilate isomerase
MAPEPDHPYEILDVFTDTPLRGNPVAVFTAGEEVPSRLMQAAALELHLSETAFMLPGDDEADATVRIFTPAAELPFAGHPVLGTAFVVGERQNLATVRLRTRVGIVPVRLAREHGEIVFGQMDQPIPTVSLYEHPDKRLLDALGVEDEPALPIERYVNGPAHIIVALRDPEQVRALEPDMLELARLGEYTISCCALDGAGVKTRCFAPSLGVREDPATGSAAGPLALHLARYGLIAFGQAVWIEQGAEIGRPSRLQARVEGSPELTEGVVVGGSAVPVARGRFRLQ